MADEEIVGVSGSGSGATLTAVDTPVSTTPKESSESIAEKLKPSKPAEAKAPAQEKKDAVKPNNPQRKVSTKSSDEIAKQLAEQAKRSGEPDTNKSESKDGTKDSVNAPEKAQEVEDRSKWFDPEKGFKTADDMKKSYGELQSTLTKKSEEIKLERTRLELEQAQIKDEAQKLKEIQEKRPLTTEEKAQKAAVEQWKTDNKDALDLIKDTIKKDLDQENLQKKQIEVQSSVQEQILKERNEWLSGFNKDPGRKELWGKMEQIYKEKGDTADKVIHDFAKNPLPYIEAMAFHKNFPDIAEKIKLEAVQQYVATQKQAAEAERKTRFALPGGPKSGSGDLDVSKMSSKELAQLLPYNENG